MNDIDNKDESKFDVNELISKLNSTLSGIDFGVQNDDVYVENTCKNHVKTQHIDCEYLSSSKNGDGTVTIKYRPKNLPEVISVDFESSNDKLKKMFINRLDTVIKMSDEEPNIDLTEY